MTQKFFTKKGEMFKNHSSTNKFRAKKMEYDGMIFDSIRECARYRELKLLESINHIRNLKRQVIYPFFVNGELICKYIADFVYEEKERTVVEDLKSPATRKTHTFTIKKKLLKALYGLDIRVTY